ncbi:calcium-binding protein [Phenylobacterium sp.]|uniref:calcium-binding protein n=1 Tax=Phenylobacterium sp. TaxID=1871053 RepID=UPI002B9FB9E8|nr:calcium-binding protein [Phenylobacterium sp.]HLZ76794.1 calcium-binding protein [Phenylobacterium sp.]
MSTFAFETITAAQALAIGSADSLTVAAATGTAVGATVLYQGDGTIDLNFVGGQTLVFGPNLAALSQAGLLTLADGSILYVGDANSNTFNTLFFNGVSNGAQAAAFGGAGDDSLSVNGAHNLLQGNAGNDSLTGAQGDDTIYGGQDNDVIDVGGGVNFGQGNKGNDTLTGSGTSDTLLGGQGNDNITGTGFLDGNLGDDHVSGSGQLFGEGGNDTLTSIGSGKDTLSGGDGNDSLVAGQGQDSITGDAGDDTISITGGAQVIAGGPGADKFIFGAGLTSTGNVPTIIDWDGTQDTISFLGFTPNPSDYTTATAATYADALADAQRLTMQNHFSFVGVQVGADFIIFAGGSGGPSSVVDLVGRSMADFDPHHNLI